jgi:hypothetical protein
MSENENLFDWLPDADSTQQPQASEPGEPKPGNASQPSNKPAAAQKLNVDKVFVLEGFKNAVHFRRYIMYHFQRLENLKNIDVAKNKFSEQAIRNRIEIDFYGPNTNYETLIAHKYKTFQNPDLFFKILEKFKSVVPKKLENSIPVKKLKYNSMGFGTMDTARALSTAKTVKAYYDLETNEKVENKNVEKQNGIFVDTTTNREVQQKTVLQNNGLPKVQSQTKNVYGFFQQQKKQVSAIELNVFFSVAGREEAEKTLYNGLAAIVLADILLKRGYKVKVNTFITGENASQKVIFIKIPCKNWHETIDPLNIAFYASDPRFFRYAGFQCTIVGFDVNKAQAIDQVSYVIPKPDAIEILKKIDYQKTSKEPLADVSLFFGDSRSESDALEELKNAIQFITQTKK